MEDLAGETAELHNSMEEDRSAQNAMSEAQEQLSDVEKNQKDKQQLDQMKKQFDELKKQRAVTQANVESKVRAWNEKASAIIGEPIDIRTFKYETATPRVQEFIEQITTDVQTKIKNLQKSLGEPVGPLKEDSLTFKKIWEKCKANKVTTALALMVTISVIGGLAGNSSTEIWNKHDPPALVRASIGCYQYNIKTGKIKKLNCNLNDDKKEGSMCDQICQDDSDCSDNKNSTDKCLSISDCPVGALSCSSSGYCNWQTCDQTSNTCSVSNRPIISQVKDPNSQIKLCLGSTPISQCSVANMICQPVSKDGKGGGSCNLCNTQGADPSDCAETGSDWIMVPMCLDSPSFIINLAQISLSATDWMPSKTPIGVWIVVGIGLLGFVITFIKYIINLIKHVKNK